MATARDVYDISEFWFIDTEMGVMVEFEPQELAVVEWDGYPENRDFNSSAWYMVELSDDEASYFPNRDDMSNSALEAILNFCDGLVSADLNQDL